LVGGWKLVVVLVMFQGGEQRDAVVPSEVTYASEVDCVAAAIERVETFIHGRDANTDQPPGWDSQWSYNGSYCLPENEAPWGLTGRPLPVSREGDFVAMPRGPIHRTQ
jgi:hypothetical protein